MASKSELRERLKTETKRADYWLNVATGYAEEHDAMRSTISDARGERDDALTRLAAAQGLIRDLTTPTPEPLKVGDRVRVGEEPTFTTALRRRRPCDVARAGDEGTVLDFYQDGDARVRLDHATRGEFAIVHPDHLTRLDPEPEAEDAPAEVVPACRAVANLRGEHLACDIKRPHDVHGNISAGLIWAETGEPSSFETPRSEWSHPAVVVTWHDGTIARYEGCEQIDFGADGGFRIVDDANRTRAVVFGARAIEVIR